ALARGIDHKLGEVSKDHLQQLGEIALAWGHRRSGPLYQLGDLGDLSYRSLGNPRVLLPSASGGTRFVHDTVQDFCAAHAVAVRLANAEERRGPQADSHVDAEERA